MIFEKAAFYKEAAFFFLPIFNPNIRFNMQIELSAVVPVPLRDRIRQRPSDIWDREVSFQPGQRVKIKAPSGTGKTTLVHYLYNIRYDYTGTIKAGGKPWEIIPPRSWPLCGRRPSASYSRTFACSIS